MKTINFYHNFNNKLLCVYFTTIRLRNDDKYKVGETYQITYNGQQLPPAELVALRHIKLADLTETMAGLDTGSNLDWGRRQLMRIYQDAGKKVNWETQELTYIVLKQPETIIRYLVPTWKRKTDINEPLYNQPELFE